MKKLILQLQKRFLTLFNKKTKAKKIKANRLVFDTQQNIQKKIQNITTQPQAVLPKIPMAQVTIQTIQIPMVDPATLKQAVQNSINQLPMPAPRKHQPNILRKPLSEKDIANISAILKSFHGSDVRDLF